MALSKDYIGKKCYIDMEDNPNIDKSMLGTIINYYSDGSDTYVEVSMNPYGEVIKVRDDSLITIIDSGSGGGGGGGGGDTPPYPPLPSDYQELEYLVTTQANGYPRIIADGFGVQAGDHAKFTFGGRGVICGQRSNGWNFNVDTVNQFNVVLYHDSKVFYSWENLGQSLGETAYVCEISFSSTFANNMTYGGWGISIASWDYNFEGNLGVFMVLRPTIVGDDLQTISQKYVCVRVLIPCYRKADGVNGFYDSVNNVFYTAVFGTFTRGPEKN